MQIDYRIGDMFKGRHRFIAHGCNAQGVMGSGVAKIVHDGYHYAYKAYHADYTTRGLALGNVIVASPSVGKGLPVIFNCITQNRYGTDQRYANYGAIQECVRKIDDYMRERVCAGDREVAFPMIGAGLAGGDWPTIAQIIEREAEYFQPVVYDFTP